MSDNDYCPCVSLLVAARIASHTSFTHSLDFTIPLRHEQCDVLFTVQMLGERLEEKKATVIWRRWFLEVRDRCLWSPRRTLARSALCLCRVRC